LVFNYVSLVDEFSFLWLGLQNDSTDLNIHVKILAQSPVVLERNKNLETWVILNVFYGNCGWFKSKFIKLIVEGQEVLKVRLKYWFKEDYRVVVRVNNLWESDHYVIRYWDLFSKFYRENKWLELSLKIGRFVYFRGGGFNYRKFN